jgi:hypothetical protein
VYGRHEINDYVFVIVRNNLNWNAKCYVSAVGDFNESCYQ